MLALANGESRQKIVTEPGAVMLRDHPFLLFVVALLGLWAAAFFGAAGQKIWRGLRRDEEDEFKAIQAAALTLLGLLVGFSFSMAVSRYDLRQAREAAEANAIGTEFLRAELLAPESAAELQKNLRAWLDLRVKFYRAEHSDEISRIEQDEDKTAAQIWALVRDAARQKPDPTAALAVAGANETLDARGAVAAAWRNRIPTAAWALMAVIAAFCSGLLGYGGQRFNPFLLVLAPATIATAFLLIAEIDSPRGGFIRVAPANLDILAQQLSAK